MKHALAAADLNAMVRLFRAQAEQLFSRGEILRLLAWLDALPDGVVRAHPDLCGYKAWLLFLRGRTAQAKSYAALAREVNHVAAPMAQRAMLYTFQAYLAINWGAPVEAIPAAKQALELLQESQSFFRVYALSFLGQAQNATGDRRAAVDTFRLAVELGQTLDHQLVTLDALVHLAPMLYAQGRLREAVVLCRNAADEYVDARDKPLPVAGLVHVALGVLYFELNELSMCRHELDTGIALCQRLGMVYYTLMGQRALARMQHACGDREAAWNTLAAARELAEGSENPGRWRSIAVLTADLQLREGNATAAARSLAELGTPVGASAEYQTFTEARLLLARAKADRAEELLVNLQAAASQDGRDGSLISIGVLQALCRLAKRDRPGALQRLAEAVSLAASGGYRRVFLDEGAPVAALLADVRHAAPEFVDALLAEFPDYEKEPTTPDMGALVEPLSKVQLHILRLLDRGHTNQEIADHLTISVGTTKWHLNQMFGKLQVRNRTSALARARDLGLL
jgi:LuxR family maltose regulon positive regulatory protein